MEEGKDDEYVPVLNGKPQRPVCPTGQAEMLNHKLYRPGRFAIMRDKISSVQV